MEAVRLRLHVREADGPLAVGAAAFAALWRHTLGQCELGRFIDLPGIRALAAWAYMTA